MNRKDLSFLKKIFIHNNLKKYKVLIINQTTSDVLLKSDFNNIRVINSFDIGLSKSRNLAINNAIGDICMIADDDIEYVKNFQEIVKAAFISLSKVSVVLFKIETFNGENYKTYPKVSKKSYKKKDLIKTSSIEIAFRREDILINSISFNHLFGLGSIYPSGEEYLFLKDVIGKDLGVYFENKFIVKHSFERSTSYIGSDNYIKAKAALYYHDHKKLAHLYLLKLIFFLVRKKAVNFNELVKKYKVGYYSIKTYVTILKEK